MQQVAPCMSLDDCCGSYLTFRDLICCGETQQLTGIANKPVEMRTYQALEVLAKRVLDPVIKEFGPISITFGFCSAELAAKIPGRIAPKLDQHAAYEKNKQGRTICERGGAAVDFIVTDQSMLHVSKWIVENTAFDRLYFYGDEKPVHVSVGPEAKREIVLMMERPNGRRIPNVVTEKRFAGLSRPN